jgi:hypothetical protein
MEGAGFEPSVPRYGELGAPGPRATRPRAIVKPRDADRSASTSSQLTPPSSGESTAKLTFGGASCR